MCSSLGFCCVAFSITNHKCQKYIPINTIYIYIYIYINYRSANEKKIKANTAFLFPYKCFKILSMDQWLLHISSHTTALRHSPLRHTQACWAQGLACFALDLILICINTIWSYELEHNLALPYSSQNIGSLCVQGSLLAVVHVSHGQKSSSVVCSLSLCFLFSSMVSLLISVSLQNLTKFLEDKRAWYWGKSLSILEVSDWLLDF